ncbi:helix-turn-helix transcriptional regulator [Streptomyces sp. ISL-43]|uniref:helix-turn-helix domain-containing protein n=1 Tax=Streptomyces sp. ISL-43 TaxID=2819183 RepID=UPI001BEA3607|nr:helix-turn-helix transcriptional regulator [Streptomyces sp. ISL-43]MBT2451816.1 helix-turn-helix transcriptional regulator [Streptomyces sp. ISL-43]
MTQADFDDGNEDDVPEWADRLMADVAREVRRRRKEMKWSAQDLADRCEQIGFPIPRNVIANMESGRRAVLPLVEVMVLAEALYTHPLRLIYPVGYVEEVQQLPLTYPVDTAKAMRWFAGLNEDYQADHRMLRHHVAHATALERAAIAVQLEAQQGWVVERAIDDTARAKALRTQAEFAERAARARDELYQVRSEIYADGEPLPDLPDELADVDPAEGYERDTD